MDRHWSAEPQEWKEWPVHADFSSEPIIRNISDLSRPSKRPYGIEDISASQPWAELKKRYLFIAFCTLILLPLFFFFFFPVSCVCWSIQTPDFFLKHSSFVYLSVPITDLRLSDCSDSTFPCDRSLSDDASSGVLVLKPLVLCKVTELPHWALTLGV